MFDLDMLTRNVVLPWWGVAAFGVVVLFFILALFSRESGRHVLGQFLKLAFASAFLALAWVAYDHLRTYDRAQERHALEARLTALDANASAPGSALACLEADNHEAVQEACEKALFANAQSVAAAASYVANKLKLLNEVMAFSSRNGGSVDEMVANMRQSLEEDHYGIVAHVLEKREGCTADQCDMIDLFSNAERINANLKDHAFETVLARYLPRWGVANGAVTGSSEGGPALANAPQRSWLDSLPSAASIPPVSIMNNEPGIAGQNGVSSDAKPPVQPPAPKPAAAAPAPAPSKPAAAPPPARRTESRPAPRRSEPPRPAAPTPAPDARPPTSLAPPADE